MTFFEMDLRIIGYSLFIISIITTLISSIYFFLDVIISLKALFIATKEYLN